MRLLRNIVLIALPLLLMVNLYRWVFADSSGVEYTFKGFAFLHSRIQSFPGLDMTFTMFESIQEKATAFNDIEINSLLDVFTAVSNMAQLIGQAFSIPIMIVIDVVRDIWWFIDSMFIS